MIANTPSIDLAIDDAIKYMADRSMKNAEYVAEVFGDSVEQYDPKDMFVEIFPFDGVSTMHKGGMILTEKYPCVYIHNGGSMSFLYSFLVFQ